MLHWQHMDKQVEADRQGRFWAIRQRGKDVVLRPVGWFLLACRAVWRYLGKLGLALRNLLTWFVWKPLFFLTLPLWLPLGWLWELTRPFLPKIWRFAGRVGLAERRLLVLAARPFRWLLRQLAQGAAWVWGILKRIVLRIASVVWQITAPARARLRKRYGSMARVYLARLRVFLLRPKPPRTAVLAPKAPTAGQPSPKAVTRLALVTTIAVLLFATAFMLSRQTPAAAVVTAVTPEKIVVILTPTPRPEEPPASAPQIDVKLTPWATPDPLATGGTLAFTLHQDGNSDIYIMPVGQREPVQLTSHTAPDIQPAWSPDGQSLAFASRRDGNWELYVYNLPEQTLRRVTNHMGYDGNPAWSPDSQWLVYESYQNGNMDIYIVRADGSEGPFRLTENDALDYDPVWSPGGRHVAFVSWRSGNKDIFVLSLDEVTDEAAFNVTQSPDRYEDAPVFSPDGRFLAYHDASGVAPFVYLLPLNSDYLPAGEPLNAGQQGEWAVWSPNGRSLMVVYNDDEHGYLLGTAPEGWGVAPQVFEAKGRIEGSPSWTAVQLTPDLLARLENIDQNETAQVLYKEALFAPPPAGPPVLLQQVPVNAPSPYLNDRVDDSFLALRERLIAEAGWDVLGRLDQMFASLDEQPLPGQPRQSWHQAGRAFDLPYRDVLAFEPRIEVVREDVGTETYWRVYVKTDAQDGTQGQPLRDLPWDFRARFEGDPQYYDEGGKPKDAIPAGYYVDFTALAADYGWQRVPALDNWRTYFQGIRFWQFENRQGLLWSEAMLELYSPEELVGVLPDPSD